MYLCIYVDDIIIACSELAYICEIKQKLRDRYDMIDMGALEHFLNVRVTRSCSYIQPNQSVYSQKVLGTLSAYRGTENKIRKCPLPSDTMDRIAKKPKECSEEDHRYVDNFPYRSIPISVDEHEVGHIIRCGITISVWIEAH